MVELTTKLLTVGAAAMVALGAPAHAAEFELTFEGVPEEAQADLRRASEIIVPCLVSDMPNDYINYFDHSFALHEQDGTPSLYDSTLKLADGRGLADFANPSLELTYAIANPTIYFDGEQAKAANRGFPVGVVPLSVTHLPTPPRSAEPMMADASGQGEVRRSNDPLALAMLADLGWTIADECRSWN